MENRVVAVGLCMVALALALPLDRVAVAGDEVAEELMALEKAAWDAWAKGDMAFFENHMHENAVNVSGGEMTLGRAAIIATMTEAACEVRSFELGDMKAQHLGKDAVILAYEAKQDGTCSGEGIDPEVVATSLWVRQGDHWQAASYHETPTSD